jgi:group I intron endonuclease
MIRNYKNSANKPGIYKILNTHTNRIYIGQASRFERRWADHTNNLRKDKHCNRFFQNDFNKCKEEVGNDDFLVFEVLEVMEGSSRRERTLREQYWLDQYYDQQKQCYNLKAKAQGMPKCVSEDHSERMRKLWKTKEHKEKCAKATKEWWSNPENKAQWLKINTENTKDPERRAKVSASTKAYNATTKGKKAKSAYMKKLWTKRAKDFGTVVSPDGKEYNVTNISRFAKAHGLPHGNFSQVIYGKRNECHGWFLKGNPPKQNDEITLVSPEGEEFKVREYAQFAREHNLDNGGISLLKTGKAKTHRGWRLKV